MPLKITVDKKLQKLLSNTTKGLIPKVRKEFKKKGPSRVNAQIKREILRGVSPVKGKRFVKYSKSYLAQIRNKLGFFMKNGKLIAIKGKGNKPLIEKLNSDLRKYNKKVSPVNMRVSRGMLNKLRSYTRGGILSNFRLIIEWKHFLADIHNRKGAGKAKVIRRLLPTKSGEKFNKRISDRLFTELKKAADIVVKKNT